MCASVGEGINPPSVPIYYKATHYYTHQKFNIWSILSADVLSMRVTAIWGTMGSVLGSVSMG